MNKKIPMRTCIGCGTTRPKKELIRITLTPEGEVQVDRTGRANGRGAYICDNPDCLQKAARKKSLQKAFRTQVSAEACERLAAGQGADISARSSSTSEKPVRTQKNTHPEGGSDAG